MEKFTAASILRGKSAEQALLTVRGGGNFTAELIGRVMNRAVRLSAHDEAQGQTDDGSSHLPSKQGGAGELIEDPETLFARYTKLEETGDAALADATVAGCIPSLPVRFRWPGL